MHPLRTLLYIVYFCSIQSIPPMHEGCCDVSHVANRLICPAA